MREDGFEDKCQWMSACGHFIATRRKRACHRGSDVGSSGETLPRRPGELNDDSSRAAPRKEEHGKNMGLHLWGCSTVQKALGKSRQSSQGIPSPEMR